MSQIGRLLSVPNARLLVLTTSRTCAKALFNCMLEGVRSGTEDDGLKFKNMPMSIIGEGGQTALFQPVYHAYDIEDLVGMTFTNVLFDVMLGNQVARALPQLRGQMRSPSYQGTYTIEPIDWRDV